MNIRDEIVASLAARAERNGSARLYSHLFMVGIVGTIVFGSAAWFICAAYMYEAGWDTGSMSVSLFTFVFSAWIVAPILLFQGYWIPFVTVYLLLAPSLLLTWLLMDFEMAD